MYNETIVYKQSLWKTYVEIPYPKIKRGIVKPLQKIGSVWQQQTKRTSKKMQLRIGVQHEVKQESQETKKDQNKSKKETEQADAPRTE